MMRRRTFLEAAQYICLGSYLSSSTAEARQQPGSWSVVGIGCGGCNMAQSFATIGLPGNGCVSFVSSDAAALAYHAGIEGSKNAKTNKRFLQLGQLGFGMSGNRNLGRIATIAGITEMLPALAHSDIVFVLAGLGGGTGSGGAPVIATAAKSRGASVVALVTLPFDFEGECRRTNAIESLEELRGIADQIAVFELQGLLASTHCNSSQDVAFNAVDHAMIAYANRACAGTTTAPETRLSL